MRRLHLHLAPAASNGQIVLIKCVLEDYELHAAKCTSVTPTIRLCADASRDAAPRGESRCYFFHSSLSSQSRSRLSLLKSDVVVTYYSSSNCVRDRKELAPCRAGADLGNPPSRPGEVTSTRYGAFSLAALMQACLPACLAPERKGRDLKLDLIVGFTTTKDDGK